MQHPTLKKHFEYYHENKKSAFIVLDNELKYTTKSIVEVNDDCLVIVDKFDSTIMISFDNIVRVEDAR